MERPLTVNFFRLKSGREPVREWLKSLDYAHRKVIGEDIKTLQFGWPVGMPITRKLAPNLWELRSNLNIGIARIFITIYDKRIILLHGFVKKSQKIPKHELSLAKERLSELRY